MLEIEYTVGKLCYHKIDSMLAEYPTNRQEHCKACNGLKDSCFQDRFVAMESTQRPVRKGRLAYLLNTK